MTAETIANSHKTTERQQKQKWQGRRQQKECQQHHRHHQRQRDRRPSMTASPGCLAMRTKKVKKWAVHEENNILYCIGLLEQPSQEKNYCTGTTSPTNQPRTDLFLCTPRVPFCLSFNGQQGPPLSGLSGHQQQQELQEKQGSQQHKECQHQ